MNYDVLSGMTHCFHPSAVQLNDALNAPVSLLDGFGGYDGVGYPVRFCKCRYENPFSRISCHIWPTYMQPLWRRGTLAAAHMLRASAALQGFYLVNGNFSLLGVSNAYSPAVASQPNVVTNSLGLPASISVSRLGVLLNTGQTFQVRGRPSQACILPTLHRPLCKHPADGQTAV